MDDERWKDFLFISGSSCVIVIDNDNNICSTSLEYGWGLHTFVEVKTSITFDNRGE